MNNHEERKDPIIIPSIIFGFMVLLSILKIFGYIDLSWVVITLPILIPVGIVAFIFTLILIYGIFFRS